jgi:hypothetical protein
VNNNPVDLLVYYRLAGIDVNFHSAFTPSLQTLKY